MIFRHIQNYFTFHPERAQPGDLSTFDQTDTYLETSDGPIHVRYRIRDSESKCILFSHGNSSSIESIVPTYALYEELGLSYVAYDYPGYGKSAGRPSQSGLYRSFAATYAFVKDTLGIPAEQLYLHGMSLGGAVTIHHLPTLDVKGAILESTFTSAADMATVMFPKLPVMRLFSSGYDSLARIPKVQCDLLFIHGDEDPTIPVVHSERLHRAAIAPSSFYSIPKCGHVNQKEIGGERYKEVWRVFLQEGALAVEQLLSDSP